MYNDLKNLFQVANNRIFIDIAVNGCGSGCAYCFTKSPSEEQALLSASVVSEICDLIDSLPIDINIISLCPNTDPMKSDMSKELTYQVVSYFTPKGYEIQISTKEYIHSDYLELLNDAAKHKGQIRVSVSLPYISKAFQIEPFASPVNVRLDNFHRIHLFEGLSSTLYLRPFNLSMIAEKDTFVDVIRKYRPQHICLGVEYITGNTLYDKCTTLNNDYFASQYFEKTDLSNALYFADYIRSNTGYKVFHSSICNIVNNTSLDCSIKLHNYCIDLCRDCKLKDSL